MRKLAILGLSVASALCFTLAACKDNESKEINFVDFENTSVNVELGESFSLREYMKVYDDQNVLYSANVELLNSQGSAVEHLAYEFTIEDNKGYTVILSVCDPVTGEVLKMRTVTLVVVDESAPYISVGDMPEYGLAGEEVKIPLSFTDANDNYNTAVIVNKIDYNLSIKDYDESLATPMDVEYESKAKQASFTPEKPGRYKVTIEAWEGAEKESAVQSGKNIYRAKTFYYEVKGEVSQGEIEGFDAPETVTAAYNYNPNAEESKKVYKTDSNGVPAKYKDGKWVALSETELQDLPTYGTVDYKAMQNDSAVWHEEFAGKFGVLALNSTNKTGAGTEQSPYSYEYYIKSTYRNSNFYRYGVDENGDTDTSVSWENDNRWNYLSVWVYVKGENGEKVTLSGRYNTGKSEIDCNSWYELKLKKTECNTALGNPYNVFADGNLTFNALLLSTGNHEIYLDKIAYEWSEEFHTVPLADNEVEAFSTQNTLVGAYGINANSKPDKNTKNQNAQWHAEFAGKQGVVSLKPTETSGYGGHYYLCSMTRADSFYRYGVDASGNADKSIDWRDDIRWDYLSVWVYIVGEENEQVEISGRWDLSATTVQCNSWVELKLSKDYLGNSTNGGMKNPFYTLSATNNNNNVPLFIVGEGTEANYTVYVDKISYEKSAN